MTVHVTVKESFYSKMAVIMMEILFRIEQMALVQ